MSFTDEHKKKARDALFGGTGAVKEAVAEVLATEFPNIFPPTVSGKMYSDVFGDYYDATKMKDFPLPDIGEIPEWAQGFIPETSDYWGESHVIYDAVVAYALKSVTHLVGFPGTGKSEGLPKFLAHRLQLPLLRLGLNKKGMGLDDLIGRESIENDDGVSVTRHRDGVLVKWVQMPSIILADEFARANVEITNGLMSLMEKDGKLIIENRHDPIIHRGKDCWILASDNVKGTGDSGVGMIGTDQLDGAVLDRFTCTIEVDYLPPEKSAALLMRTIEGYPPKMARLLSMFGKRIQDAYKEGRLPISFSQRSMYAIALKSCVTHDLNGSVRSVFLNRFDSDDKTFVAQVWQDITGDEL